MASKPVRDAFAAFVAANWIHTPVLGLNVDVTPPADGSAFFLVEFPVSNEDQISLGAVGTRTFREEGAARFVLCVPIGAGLDPFTQWLDDFRSALRGTKIGTATDTVSAVNTFAPSPPFVNDQSDRGSYWELSFACPFYLDIFG